VAPDAFRDLVAKVRTIAPDLKHEELLGSGAAVAEIVFPPQSGLEFRVVLQLQHDLLCLGLGDLLWNEYPDTTTGAADFASSARCALSGECRLIETLRNGVIVEARLEKLQDGAWVQIANHHTLHIPYGKRETRILERIPPRANGEAK